MTLSLERLPPEVLIPVLGFLDPADLAVCNRLSKYLKIFIDANREIISANCAIRLGFTLGQSAGDAGVYTSSQTRTLTLGKAIQNQQSALKAYANVQTWHDFVKKRVTIDRNWRQLNCVERQVHYESSVWRFKVDTESGVIISSCGTRSPYLVAVDLSENAVQNTSQVTVGFTSWSFAAASLPEYTHIECSNGYIVHTMADASFAIWKRCAPRQVANFEPENPRLRISSFVATSSHIAYRPHKRIAPPRQINCYKARFPYLVAGSSRRRRQAFVWHIESGELLKEIPLVESDLAESALSYIEVDNNHLYVAGISTIQVYSLATGNLQGVLPPYIPSIACDGSIAYWTAIHHTKNHIVAISEGSRLLLISKPDPYTIPWADFHDRAVYAVMHGLNLSNLSVENDRCACSGYAVCFLLPFVPYQCAFLIRSSVLQDNDGDGVIQVLMLLHLPRFDSISAFEKVLPRLKMLSDVCPSTGSITRLEMDGTAIYVTYTQSDAASNARVNATRRRSLASANSRLALWKTCDTDMILGRALDEPELRASDTAEDMRASSRDWRRNSIQLDGDNTPDRVYIYDFDVTP